jgi:carboxylesterase type B
MPITCGSYRLGVYGFLDSSALREAGIKANRGLRDQRSALEWIQENIEGFGGDPERVAFVGESVGGGKQLCEPNSPSTDKHGHC